MFSKCTSLERIELPNVEIIDSSSFNECTNLTYITMPKVKEIKNNAFYRTNLGPNLEFPSTLEIIEYYAFMSNNKLTDFYCPGRTEAPSTWDNNWNHNKNITIHWNTPMPTES